MADYIVDASVVIEYLISDTFTPQVMGFFNGITSSDRLTVPEFCLLECTNVIWKQARFSGLSRGDAKELLNVLRVLKLRRAPMKRLLESSLNIALQHNLAVYDSGYSALAVHYSYPLISLDQPQIRAALAEGVSVIPLTNFPTT